MTLEEKVGQLVQVSGNIVTGPSGEPINITDFAKQGKVGTVLNIAGIKNIREVQEAAMQSRLKIPLIFALDVIHGYKTMFPQPLAQACSWDPNVVSTAAEVSGREAAASGIGWTFTPMIDIARDPRWGRITEGFGEDPVLVSRLTKAAVKGYERDNLSSNFSILSTAKHYVAYGAA